MNIHVIGPRVLPTQVRPSSSSAIKSWTRSVKSDEWILSMGDNGLGVTGKVGTTPIL
jgi:hypothetical protein